LIDVHILYEIPHFGKGKQNELNSCGKRDVLCTSYILGRALNHSKQCMDRRDRELNKMLQQRTLLTVARFTKLS
jgi:hypothetical protein